ncbi:hypothetical protein Ae263Ps1_6148c [Pseudonocardia sp. Ae263_Ps1]|nr:hypothetical protein Ae263Ps1_6148c [Pseudonocardia sp. Ae263_Ps1]
MLSMTAGLADWVWKGSSMFRGSADVALSANPVG